MCLQTYYSQKHEVVDLLVFNKALITHTDFYRIE